MAYPIQTATLESNVPFPQLGGQVGKISGYIFNPSQTGIATIIIRGVNNSGKLTRSINPLSYLNFSSLEFEQILVTSTSNLDIVYSENVSFSLSETTSSPDTSVNQLYTSNIRNLTPSDQPLISGTLRTPDTLTGTFVGTTGIVLTPSSGNVWKLRSIALEWTAATTQTDYPQIQIYPNSITSSLSKSVLNLVFISLAVTATDVYTVDCSEYVQTRASSLIYTYYVSEQNIPNDFVIYPNESLRLFVNNETANISYYVSYFIEKIG